MTGYITDDRRTSGLFDIDSSGWLSCRVTKWKAGPVRPRVMGEPHPDCEYIIYTNPPTQLFTVPDAKTAAQYLAVALLAFNEGRCHK
jgi:hypothetical protein